MKPFSRITALAPAFLLFFVPGLVVAADSSPAGAPDASSSKSITAESAAGQRASSQETTPYEETVPVTIQSDVRDTARAEKKSSSRIIEEIVVTAQKREELLQNVPISVAAFSGDALEARGVVDPTDLPKVAPGLTYSLLAGYSLIYIRGVGSDAFVPSADASVATYLDGVYLPFSHALATSFLKLERLEVLKGPQGTLFGRNSTGGAINIVTKSPSDHLEGSLDGSIGSYNSRNAKGFIAGPIVDDVSGSLSVIASDADSYYKLLDDSPDQSIRPEKTRGAALKLQWDPADEFTASLNGFITHSLSTVSLINTPQDTRPLGTLIGTRNLGPYEASTGSDPHFESRNKLGYGTLVSRLKPFDIKLLGSVQHVRTATPFDFDGDKANIALFDVSGQKADIVTSELQFTSKPDGLFGDFLEWTGGLYYYKASLGYDPVFFSALPLSNEYPPFPALKSVIDALGAVSPIPIPDGARLELRGVVNTESYAGYAQAKWEPLDWIGLTLGGRYQYEDRYIKKSSSSLANEDGSSTTLFNFLNGQEAKTKDISPKVTLDFKVIEDTLLYASWQKGFKSGTFNVVSIYTPPDYVKPEEVVAVELGLKGHFFEGGLRYSAAAFHSKIDNLQAQVVSLQSGGAVQLLNAAKATIKGVDFDLTWQVFPDSLPGLVVTASGAYLDATYEDFPDGAGFDETTGLYFGPGALVPSTNQDFSGNRVVRTPKWSATMGVNYIFDLSDGSIELGLDGYHSTNYFFDSQNTSVQPAYTVINARTSYLYAPWNVRATVFAKNLNDEEYFNNKFSTDFGVLSSYAMPRSYGFGLSWEF